MKLLGAVLIFSSFFLFGLYLSFRVKLRVRRLEDAVYYISAVTEEMRMTNAEVKSILERIKSDGVFIKNGEWQGTDGLKSEDIHLLNSYLSQLGKTDIQGQIKNAEIHLTSIQQNISSARTDSGKSRLYISLCSLIGLLVVVLII